MNSRIYRRPISVQTRSNVILAVIFLGIAFGILQGLPDAFSALLDLFGV